MSTDKNKFSIMSYRSMEYSKDSLFCSILANSIGKEELDFKKKLLF